MGWLKAVHPDDLRAVDEQMRSALNQGVPFEWEAHLRKVSPSNPNGLVPVRARCIPVLGEDGKIQEWVCNASDNSVLEELLRNEERLRLATQAARVAIWEYDFVAGQMTRTDNHDALYGLPSQGVWTYDVFIRATHPDDRDLSDGYIQQCVAPGGPDSYAFDFRVIWPDGTLHWLAVSGQVAARDENGTATLVRGALIEVTRLKEVESELRESVRIRDEFLQIAGHELKTPLTPLALKLGSLMRKAKAASGPDSDFVTHLESAGRQVTRLTELVNGLLDVSRLTQGRLKLEPKPTSLDQLVREVSDQFTLQAERAHSPLKLELQSGVIGLWDSARLEQVVANLLTNAIKYGAGHPVEVRVDAGDDQARLVVKDHGIGIPQEGLRRIFGKFERAVSDRNYGGLGLGLFIAKQIVDAHRGSITVESQPGKGATFTVELPLQP